MLRAALLVFGGIVLLFAVLLALVAPVWTMAVAPMLVGVLIVGGVLLERYRYRATVDQPPSDPGWAMTSERFVDPDTEELMIVWYNRRTGKRLYVRSGQG